MPLERFFFVVIQIDCTVRTPNKFQSAVFQDFIYTFNSMGLICYCQGKSSVTHTLLKRLICCCCCCPLFELHVAEILKIRVPGCRGKQLLQLQKLLECKIVNPFNGINWSETSEEAQIEL